MEPLCRMQEDLIGEDAEAVSSLVMEFEGSIAIWTLRRKLK